MELILGIEEVEGVMDPRDGQQSYGSYDGYKVTTEKQTIWVLIDNNQNCCEDWGYLHSEKDVGGLIRFSGADLLSVKIVDEEYNVSDIDLGGLECGRAVFVNFETSKGLLQLVAYNSHNGYYGHEVRVVSDKLDVSVGI